MGTVMRSIFTDKGNQEELFLSGVGRCKLTLAHPGLKAHPVSSFETEKLLQCFQFET